jgi:hypothetical protein
MRNFSTVNSLQIGPCVNRESGNNPTSFSIHPPNINRIITNKLKNARAKHDDCMVSLALNGFVGMKNSLAAYRYSISRKTA